MNGVFSFLEIFVEKDIYARATGTANQPKREVPAPPYQSPVTGSMESLYVAIEGLDGQIRDLVSRLEPVLGQNKPRECAAEVEEIAECKICDAINSRTRQIRGISSMVIDTLDRLKL